MSHLISDPSDPPNEILGQGAFRYRATAGWGELDPNTCPVNDCHSITEDHAGRIVVLTNETRNNLIAYSKSGQYIASWETRFPGGHALDIRPYKGDEMYWITDYRLGVISLCTPDGREIRRVGREAVASLYPDPSRYRPTNIAIMPDGDFYVSDGYGANWIHHFDPDWRYVTSFGGTGSAPENLSTPHSVWLDTRLGKPTLLVCDRANELLKWFSLTGELQRSITLPNTQPSNIVQLADGHIAITSLNKMVLVLNKEDRVVSVLGGDAPVYQDNVLQPPVVNNETLRCPHGIYVDSTGALYLAQWNSDRTYPLKLEPVRD